MSTQLEKITAFVDSITTNQLNESQQSLLLNSGLEERIGGSTINKGACINNTCEKSSNGGKCTNRSTCTESTNGSRCTNAKDAGCLANSKKQSTNSGRPALPNPNIVIRFFSTEE